MGGTEKECDDKGPTMKSKEDVSEAIISKLLNDFNSAALLKGSVSSKPDLDASNESVGCEEIASSLKHLHLRKPANSRQKFKERRAGSRKGRTSGNKYNLSVAAVNVQRPIVWPGKLNSSSKDNLPVLHPPKLSIPTKEESFGVHNSSTSVVSTCSAERSKIEPEMKRHHVRQFGSLSESRQYPSFSYLSEKHSGLDSLSETATTDNTKSIPSSSSSVKRPNSCHFPVAKHPRLYNEIHVSSDIAQFLDFRCPDSYEDNANANSLSPSKTVDLDTDILQDSLPSKKDHLGSRLKADNTLSSDPNVTSASSERTSNSQECTMDESNVNELASYFDDFLHIPRKMSVMAEMMYA